MNKQLLAVAVTAAATLVGGPSVSADAGEDQFVAGVTELTNLTKDQAAWIYKNDATLARSMPVSATETESLTATRNGCTVTTTRKVRNNIQAVMFSFTMRQSWTYDGWRVYPSTPTIDWDITAWGAAWAWNGLTTPNDGWYWTSGSSGSAYEVHTSRRTGQFVIQGPWPVYNNARRKIEKWYNGDWATTSDVGLPGCRDSD